MRAPGALVVGISAHYHDSACAVVRDGVLVAAAQEERFTRRKNEAALPVNAFRACLKSVGATVADIDRLAYYEQPVAKLGRQLWTLAQMGSSAAVGDLAHLEPQRPEREIRELLGWAGPIDYVPHHLSHAASSYRLSGFDQAAVLVVDAVGEWASTSWGAGRGPALVLTEQIDFPHSLGLLYSAITDYLGFEVNEGEYKVMGLAPYGHPTYVDAIMQMIDVEPDGRYRLNLDCFNFASSERMFTPRFVELLGADPRAPESEFVRADYDLARSIQQVTEDIMVRLADTAMDRADSDRLCLAGGVALNVVANRCIEERTRVSDLFVQPASGDAGGSIGAALEVSHRIYGASSATRMTSALLGPAPEHGEVRSHVSATAAPIADYEGREQDLLADVVARLADGQVIGWYHGAMEFGPRALGARSILADPRVPDMRDRINNLVKMREGFRPFAPAVLEEDASAHFALKHPSPFMLETCAVRSSLALPAITHVDGSARIQTVGRAQDGRFHRLLLRFRDVTGCPILLNTSFNLRGEPMVRTPEDALLCFIRSAIDCLVLDDNVILREDLPASWQDFVAMTVLRRQPRRGNVYTFL